jgi:hypothetical protein
MAAPMGDRFGAAVAREDPAVTLAGAMVRTLATTDGNVVDAMYALANAMGEVADAIKADTRVRKAAAKSGPAKKAAAPKEATATVAVANKKAPGG